MFFARFLCHKPIRKFSWAEGKEPNRWPLDSRSTDFKFNITNSNPPKTEHVTWADHFLKRWHFGFLSAMPDMLRFPHFFLLLYLTVILTLCVLCCKHQWDHWFWILILGGLGKRISRESSAETFLVALTWKCVHSLSQYHCDKSSKYH